MTLCLQWKRKVLILVCRSLGILRQSLGERKKGKTDGRNSELLNGAGIVEEGKQDETRVSEPNKPTQKETRRTLKYMYDTPII